MRETFTTLPAASRRRDFLTAAGFTALAGVAAASIALPDQVTASAITTSSGDAELIALCGRFNELERLCEATYDGVSIEAEEAAEAHREPWKVEQEDLLDRIIPLQATTLDGFRARARMWALWDGELKKDGEQSSYWEDRMAWALVRDLIAEADHG